VGSSVAGGDWHCSRVAAGAVVLRNALIVLYRSTNKGESGGNQDGRRGGGVDKLGGSSMSKLAGTSKDASMAGRVIDPGYGAFVTTERRSPGSGVLVCSS
jgi:hypothetical protein